MAIEHVYTILCEHVMQDVSGRHAFSGTFVNMDIVDTSTPKGFWLAFAFMELPDDGNEITFTSHLPNNDVHFNLKLAYENPVFESLNQYQQKMCVVKIPVSIPFPEEGVYRFILREGDREVHNLKVGVFVANQQIVEVSIADADNRS